jgi:hypothetical protein
MPRGSLFIKFGNVNSIHDMHPTQMLVMLSLFYHVTTANCKAALGSIASLRFYNVSATTDSELLYYYFDYIIPTPLGYAI